MSDFRKSLKPMSHAISPFVCSMIIKY